MDGVGAPEVEAFLRAQWRPDAHVRGFERVGPWSVALADTTAGPVAVKWAREGQGVRSDRNQLAVEAAALRFVEDVGFPDAPRLLAVDREAGLLAMTVAVGTEPLASWLRDGYGDGRTVAGLRAYATTLGRLHAAAADEKLFATALARFGARAPATEWTGVLAHGWATTASWAATTGVALEGAAKDDADAIAGQLRHPGAFTAFSNGDAGANNFLVERGGRAGTMIDFESAGFRHALLDVACFYVPGPMWLATADPRADGTEDAYRAAASPGIPAVADDGAFAIGLAAVVLGFALARFARFPTVDGRRRGDHSRVQLVSLLEAAAVVAERRDAFPHLRGWVRELAAALRRRWPDADVEVANIPPYAPRLSG